MNPYITEQGTCECIGAPMSDAGLEGYEPGSHYQYEFLNNPNITSGPYYRIYHSYNFYETCGPGIFKRYFKPLIINGSTNVSAK